MVPEEEVRFSVTRHTPRRHPTRRTLSDLGDSPKNADKRRKLESEELSKGATGKSKTTGKGAHGVCVDSLVLALEFARNALKCISFCV